MVLTPRQFCHSWWLEVFKKVKKAVVFIDNEAAECLHWNGGLFELIAAGAVCVKEFSSFERGEKCQKKAVFVTSSCRLDRSKVVLQDIICSSSFEYCVLVTAVAPSVHYFAKYGGPRDGLTDMSVFQSLEEDMLLWMGNMNYTVEIFHFPLFLVPVTNTLFLMPPFWDLFPVSEADLLQTHLNKSSEASPSELSWELQLSLRHLTASLHSLLTALDVHEDIFSLGTFSGLLAGLLESLPAAANRRKSAANPCSLILVDRTLDLTTPTSHGSDCLLDRILSVLPRLPGHTNDVAVNMSTLCSAKMTSVQDDMVLAPGCLAHPDIEPCPQVMEWLISKRPKDVLLGLHQQLLAAAPGGGDSRPTARVTPHVLEKQVTAFRGNTEAIVHSCGLLQQVLAVTQTLKSPRAMQMDQLLSLEKLLLLELNSGRDNSSGQEQIRKLFETRHERGLSFSELLGLLVHLYSLAGVDVQFSSSDERQLHQTLCWALVEDKDKLSGELSWLVSPDADINAVDKVISKVITKLQNIAQARKDLARYGSLLNQHATTPEGAVSGLLEQLVTDLTNPARPDLPDLICRSSGIKGMISMLLNRPRLHHPLDNPLLVVLVLGGVTAHEAHLIQTAITNVQTNVLVGGTRLITPANIVEAVFIGDPLIQNNSI